MIRCGAAVLAWILLGALPVRAQILPAPLPCGRHEEIRRLLAERFGERPQALGLQGNGQLLELFVSAERGTWTVVSVSPRGEGCILAAGRAWQEVPRPARAPDPEA